MKASTLTATSSIAAIAMVITGIALAQDGEGGQPSQAAVTALVVPPAAAPAQDSTLQLAVAKKPAGESLRSADEVIEEALRQPAKFEFTETPLQDVMDTIADLHKINILVDQRALDDVGIPSDCPISFDLSGVSFHSGLSLMLRPLDLTWTIHDEVLLITTSDEAESMLITKVYDVGDLVKCQEKEGSEWADYDTLIELMTSTVEPDTWDAVGGPGSIEAAPLAGADMLAISQTCQVHWQIDRLLEKFRAITEEKGSDGPTIREKPVFSPGMGGGMGGMGMGGGFGSGSVSGIGGGVPMPNKSTGMFGSGGGSGAVSTDGGSSKGPSATSPPGQPPATGDATTSPEAERVFRVYNLTDIGPMTRKMLEVAVPEAYIRPAHKSKNLIIIYARPNEHAVVRRSLEQLRVGMPDLSADMDESLWPKDTRQFRVYDLGDMEGQMVTSLLGIAVSDAVVSLGHERQLIIWALPEDHARVRKSLHEIQTVIGDKK